MSEYLTNDKYIKKISLAAYPNYKGRKFAFKVMEDTQTLDVRSYWDGGSRNYFSFVRLRDFVSVEMPQQSMFDKKIPGANVVRLIPGLACVKHCYFCGKDLGMTVYFHSLDKPKAIGENTELSLAEKIVLVYTRHLKNTYAGRTDIRYREAMKAKKISREQWEDATNSLKAKKMLNKAGAITNDGRNAIGDTQEYQLEKMI